MDFTRASDFLELIILAYLIDDGLSDPPSQLTVILYDGDPGDNGLGGTNVTASLDAGSNIVTFGVPVQVGNIYEISNSGSLNLGTAQDDINVTHVAIFGDIPGGNNELLVYYELPVALPFLTGESVTISADALKISIQEHWAQTAQLAILNWIRGTAPTSPLALYVALYTAAPGVFGGGTEVTTSIRAVGRPTPAIGWNSPIASGIYHLVTNNGVIDFGNAANTVANPLTHWGLHDAASGGNLIFWSELTIATPINVAQGDPVSFVDQQLVIRTA